MCKGDGTAPLSYAWHKDNFSIASVTAYLTIENARRDDAGVYTCVVSNSVGDKVSNQLKVDILCKFYLLLRRFRLPMAAPMCNGCPLTSFN